MLVRLSKISFSAWIFIGLGLGVVCGLFFGELCAPLDFLGKAFIKLLQMGVLPYMVVSLIHGVGSLSVEDAKLVAIKGGAILVLFWGIALAVTFGFSLSFPESGSSSFFAVSKPGRMDKVDLLDYYIPSNIFDALSDNLIPAIVFFCVFLGVALLKVRNREPFLNMLSILSKALNNMMKYVINTAPIGVFALTASAVGTISVEQLQRLQVYFVCYLVASGILVFWVLPVLVTCFTSFTFRDVLRSSKDALVLGFSTGNNFVVLAVIADSLKRLFEKLAEREKKCGNVIDSVLPLAYSFPSVGKLIEILFILFVAWYVNSSLGFGRQLELALAGVMSLFGSPKVGIPFLLEYMELPSSYFDLYIMSDVVTRRFKVLLQTMSMFTLTLIVSFIILSKPVISFRRISSIIFVTALLMITSITLARIGLSKTVGNTYYEDQILLNMEIRHQSPFRIFMDPLVTSELAPIQDELQKNIVTRIQDRGRIKIGFDDQALPFSFFNSMGQLVGYDIYFAHRLAKNLGVSIDFIHLDRSQVRDCLEKGICDIVMSAFPIRLDELGQLNFTQPYMDMKSALIVKDHRKKQFQKIANIKLIKGLKIAVTPENSAKERKQISISLPNAEIIELDNVKTFFDKEDLADALLTSDKIGKAWALLYPVYGVVVPEPNLFVYELAYPIPITPGDDKFLSYLNHWLSLEKTNEELNRQFDYWILGRTPERKVPRWSIIRDVLKWVD